jgi:hypothetical protein
VKPYASIVPAAPQSPKVRRSGGAPGKAIVSKLSAVVHAVTSAGTDTWARVRATASSPASPWLVPS